ncbi:MAG: GtrA family protein [Lachnospiraceae bacterium]|jgi:putative flippase GtrA|nr:GtrA family protein [Lachnospiraceae bacterium]
MERILKQIIHFSIVGGLTTGLDFILLALLTEIVKIPYYISNIFSFSVSLIINYLLSIHYVFLQKNNHSKIKNIFSFFGLSIIGLIINQIILVLLTQRLGVFYVFSKVISTGIVMMWNFISKKIYFEYGNNEL